MLHPSYTDLMELINNRNDETDDKVKSRYSVIIATSKRARELINQQEPLIKTKEKKAISIAIQELYEGKIDIK